MKRPILSQKKYVAALAVFYTFLWGCAFPLVKLCMQAFRVPPDDDIAKMLLAGLRFSCSGLLTCSVCLFRRSTASAQGVLCSMRDIALIVPYALFGTTLQYACTYIGLSHVTGSAGALLDQLCVFLIILASGLFCRQDRLTASKLLGCACGFLGVLLTASDGAALQFHPEGEGMMLLAAVFQTIAYFLAGRAVRRFSAVWLVGLSHLLGGLLLAAYSLICGAKLPAVDAGGAALLLALALISAAAYVLSLLPLKYFAASEVSVYNLLIPVFGGLMSGLSLREDIFNLRYLAAMAFIAAGIYLVNRQQRRETKHAKANSSDR